MFCSWLIILDLKQEKNVRGFNNSWNEVVVVLTRQLIILPSWLQLNGTVFSVCRKYWRGPRPPALSRSVSHTFSPATTSVCVCGIWGQGQPIPLQTITSHKAKYIPKYPRSNKWGGLMWEQHRVGCLAVVQTRPVGPKNLFHINKNFTVISAQACIQM